MSNFQAVVVRPSLPRGFGKDSKGRKVSLKVWVPSIGPVTLKKLEALQSAFGENLEIVPEVRQGQAVIIQRLLTCSREGIRISARKLAYEVQKHLGIPTTVQ